MCKGGIWCQLTRKEKEWAFWADSKSQRVWRTTRCNCCYTAHRTVENHVQATLGKLQLANRVELTRYAIEHGLEETE